jgi:hypothetical protein
MFTFNNKLLHEPTGEYWYLYLDNGTITSSKIVPKTNRPLEYNTSLEAKLVLNNFISSLNISFDTLKILRECFIVCDKTHDTIKLFDASDMVLLVKKFIDCAVQVPKGSSKLSQLITEINFYNSDAINKIFISDVGYYVIADSNIIGKFYLDFASKEFTNPCLDDYEKEYKTAFTLAKPLFCFHNIFLFKTKQEASSFALSMPGVTLSGDFLQIYLDALKFANE